MQLSLRKQQKFETRNYFQLYPSDPIPPRLYGVLNYTMRAIVSKIGTPPDGISQYLAELTQPTLNKSKYKITNSLSFVNEAKDWLVKRDEVQVPYDILNLYPSVPIKKALDVLMDQLNKC